MERDEKKDDDDDDDVGFMCGISGIISYCQVANRPTDQPSNHAMEKRKRR